MKLVERLKMTDSPPGERGRMCEIFQLFLNIYSVPGSRTEV